MSLLTNLHIDLANIAVNSGNLNRLSWSFTLWLFLFFLPVIDHRVSLFYTHHSVCMYVPICRQPPHHTHTHNVAKVRTMVVNFVRINIASFQPSLQSSVTCSFSGQSRRENEPKIKLFQSGLQRKGLHQNFFNTNMHNHAVLSLPVTN